MKYISFFGLGLLMGLTIHSQTINSAVSLTVWGNKNLQLNIDGQNYSLNNATTAGEKTTFRFENLASGKHSFQLDRLDPNTNRVTRINAEFILRSGYDMDINVNQDGSLEFIETRIGSASTLVPITTTAFNNLLRNVRLQRSVSGRYNVIATAFSNAKNSFTTNQVSQLLTQVNSESYRLQLAKAAYPLIDDKGNFYQLYSLINSTAGKNELADFVYNYGTGSTGSTGTAMSDANFNSLYQTIQQQWPVSAQMTSLTNAFNNTANYFTTYQAGRLIQLVSSESNRLQLAKLSYRSITDKNNFYQVYDLLNNQSSRNELEAYVNSYSGGGPGTAMSDANFNSLYQTIQQQWPVSAQMTSLTNAFNNTSNYFTTYQAGRLIQLVTAESNRLQLAKLSYRGITDKNNFYQIYDLLNNQPSRNELEAYVNNYGGGGTGTAMPDADFNSLYQTIQQQWPVSTQMTSLTNTFNNTAYYFTVYQAGRLIQLVTAESNRLQLAKLSYRSIVDKNNFSQIYSLLNTQASRNELESYVNSYNAGGGGTRTPMSDADFTALYNTINAQYLPFEQMTSLTNVFNNPNYFFTSAQVKQLIPLVSLESNRLQLAKLSYRSVTDKANFIIVYDVLNSQSSKDQLDAYVKAYKE